MTHKCHDLPDASLDIGSVISKDSDEACLRPDRGHLNVRAVVGHDGSDLV